MMKKIFNRFSKVFFYFIYQKKYLNGKYFENNSSMGYKACWKFFLSQKVKGYNRHIPWPVSPRTEISNHNNITFHNDDMQNFWHFGCYYQNFSAKIEIGRGTYIAPNVGIITANHNKDNLDLHEVGRDIIIGEKCWIGMNSIILPGVKLGDGVVVGAGSVVTKSFEEGNVTIAGSPAKIISRSELNL